MATATIHFSFLKSSGMMNGMIYGKLLIVLLLAGLYYAPQQDSPPTKPAAKAAPAKATPAAEPATADAVLDIQSIVRETEQVDMQRRKVGIFWWVPPEFWGLTLRQQGYNSEQVRKVFEPFKGYNLFIVAVGESGPGNITWVKDTEISKNLLLRDQRGNAYKPLQAVPDDVSKVVELMRPIYKNMMGNFGEGLQFVIFPVKDSTGNIFADAHQHSEIFLDVADLMGPATSTYTWKFPLTALSPPRYCEVGKEKVEANWKYCPWHGNKLEDPAPQASGPPKQKRIYRC